MIIINSGICEFSGPRAEIIEDIFGFYVSISKNKEIKKMNDIAIESLQKILEEEPDLIDSVRTLHEGPLGK
jgi:hypothetical protein